MMEIGGDEEVMQKHEENSHAAQAIECGKMAEFPGGRALGGQKKRG
jgi:hypothetical protein